MRPRLLVWALVYPGLVLLLVGVLGGIEVAPTRAQGQFVGLVIAFNDQSADDPYTVCVPYRNNMTGVDLLEASIFSDTLELNPGFGSLGSAVCQIDSQGCAVSGGEDCFCQCSADSCEFWGYFRLVNSSWQFLNVRPNQAISGPDEVYGWSWGPGTLGDGNTGGSGTPPPVRTIAQICAALTPTLTATQPGTDTPTTSATITPATSVPTSPRRDNPYENAAPSPTPPPRPANAPAAPTNAPQPTEAPAPTQAPAPTDAPPPTAPAPTDAPPLTDVPAPSQPLPPTPEPATATPEPSATLPPIPTVPPQAGTVGRPGLDTVVTPTSEPPTRVATSEPPTSVATPRAIGAAPEDQPAEPAAAPEAQEGDAFDSLPYLALVLILGGLGKVVYDAVKRRRASAAQNSADADADGDDDDM